MPVNAVIFDLDGTLYDKSFLPFRLVMSQLSKGKLKYLIRERQVRNMMKGEHFNTGEEFRTAFFKNFSLPDAAEWYYNTYIPDTIKTLANHYRIASWVSETFKYLRNKGIKTAIFSDYDHVIEKLTALGFDSNLADFLFSAPELGGLKPCKDSFGKICEITDIAPEYCLMVGDRDDTDGEGARAAGMRFLKIAGTNNITVDEIIHLI